MNFRKFMSYGDYDFNATMEDTKGECRKFFRGAKKSIKIIGGDLNNDFYNDEGVIRALKEAQVNGVTIEVVHEPIKGANSKDGIFSIPKIKIYHAKTRPEQHMMIIDNGKHVRIEQSHGKRAEITPAVIFHNAEIIADKANRTFQSLVKNSPNP